MSAATKIRTIINSLQVDGSKSDIFQLHVFLMLAKWRDEEEKPAALFTKQRQGVLIS